MVTAQTNGYQIEYNINLNQWIYSDTKEPIDIPRPCKHCGKSSTKEGYDGCLGYLLNVIHACCGHGIEKPYVILSDKSKVDFKNIEELKQYFIKKF